MVSPPAMHGRIAVLRPRMTRATVSRNGRARRPRGAASSKAAALAKCPTGIAGLDDITGGGLPQGRPTLVCGSAGCGKTLLAAEFLVRGAERHNEPGVFVSFEESDGELM